MKKLETIHRLPMDERLGNDKKEALAMARRQVTNELVKQIADFIEIEIEEEQLTQSINIKARVYVDHPINVRRLSGTAEAPKQYAPSIWSKKMAEKMPPGMFEKMMSQIQLNVELPSSPNVGDEVHITRGIMQSASELQAKQAEMNRITSERLAQLTSTVLPSPEQLHQLVTTGSTKIGPLNEAFGLSPRGQRNTEFAARQTNLEGAWHGIHYCLTTLGERIMSEKFWETGTQFAGEGKEIEKLPPVTVLVDGDIVAYRCAATCDGRHYIVKGERFGYKKDAAAYADKKGIPNTEIELHYDPEPVDTALHNIAVTMENIRNYFIYEHKLNPNIKVFLSGARNFRYDVYPEYKKSRQNQRKPHWIAECKDYMVEHWKGFRFEGFEADDLIAMTTEALRKTHDVCIASCDKDFTQLGGPNVWQYDFTTGKSWTVTDVEAMAYFYKQLLIGDKSDDIPGIPKVGPQTALKILAGCEEERAMYNAVVLAYKDKMNLSVEDAVDAVNLRGKLLWLLRKEDELWTPPPPRIQENE